MASYEIKKNSIGYLNGGDGSPVKIYFYVKFVKDDNSESSEQYYECDWNNSNTKEENLIMLYEQLQSVTEEYNIRK